MEEYEELERARDEAHADSQLLDIEKEAWEELHKLRYLSDIQSGRIARPPWLFEDFLLSQSLTLVSGEPFAGKTMLLAAMLLSLDSGEPLAGAFQPASSQRVLFVGQDSPTWDYMGQFQKLSRGLGDPYSGGSMLLLNNGLDLLDSGSLHTIEHTIEMYNINVLMLDTLLELHNLDENSNNEMKRVMGLLKHLRDKHFLSILATTHTAKDFEGKSANYRIRGASVIAGSVDQHIIVKPYYSNSKASGFYFKVPKSRGEHHQEGSPTIRFISGETPAGPSLRLEFSGDLYSERQNKVLAIIAAGATHRKDILAGLSAAYPTWDKIELQRRTTNTLAYLVKKNQLTNPERGLYSLPPEPK